MRGTGLATVTTIMSQLALSAALLAQPPAVRYQERPDQPPAASPARAADAARSAPAQIQVGPYTSVQINVDGNGDNIVGDAANEPTLAIDPTDPSSIVIGWRQFDNVSSSFRQAGWANSKDGGATWTFHGVLEPGVFRSDPVVEADAQGRFYYQSLQGDFSVQVFRSDDGGDSWGPPIPAFGGDKNWMTIDRTGGDGHGFVHQAYSLTIRDENCEPCEGDLCFDGFDFLCFDEICCLAMLCCDIGTYVRSIDRGDSYEPPLPGALSSLPLNFSFAKTLAVGLEGELYVTGWTYRDDFETSYVILYRSDDARVAGEKATFTISEVDLAGAVPSAGEPNPGGFMGQVWIDLDRSSGPQRGALYVLAGVDPDGDDPMDVMIARSDDGGATFSPPVRVNDDPIDSGAWQWFGTMAVAPNGRIDVVWNDTRNGPTARDSQLFYSYSLDGGASFSPNVAITPLWNSHLGFPNQSKIGDYYDMVSEEDTAALAYAATFNGEQDVYFTRLFPDCNENGVPDARDIRTGASSDVDGDLRPDDCQQLTLAGPAPGVAGDFNLLTVTGAVPGHRIRFFHSDALGEAAIPNCIHAAMRAELAAPKNLGQVRADDDGTAALRINVPAKTSGEIVHYQAFDVDSCAFESEVVSLAYP